MLATEVEADNTKATWQAPDDLLTNSAVIRRQIRDLRVNRSTAGDLAAAKLEGILVELLHIERYGRTDRLFMVVTVFEDLSKSEATIKARDYDHAERQANLWLEMNQAKLEPVEEIRIHEFLPGQLDDETGFWESRFDPKGVVITFGGKRDSYDDEAPISVDDLGVDRFGEFWGPGHRVFGGGAA